jgi:hypothetical protein
VETVLQEATGYDLTVLGVGEEWQLEPHVFGLRPERIAAQCPSSLLVVRTRTPSVPLTRTESGRPSPVEIPPVSSQTEPLVDS